MGTTHADFSDSEFNKHQNYVEILQGMRWSVLFEPRSY